MALLVRAAAEAATGFRTTFTIYTMLAEFAADAIAILNGKGTAGTLVRVDAPGQLIATNFAACQFVLTALLIIDARLALLATDSRAYNLCCWTASDTIFAYLAWFTAHVVTNVLRLRTAKSGGVDTGVSWIAAVFVGAPNQTL